MIETIANRHAGRPFRVELVFPEFTSIEVEGVFNVRGGMTTRAVARHGSDPVELAGT